jgi:anti-sigma B factor antagonist
MSENEAGNRLTLEVVRSGNGAVVRCRGKLVAGMSDVLYTEVKQLIPGSKRIVLDLTELTQMDSMGLGTIVRLYVSAKSADCDLELINLGQGILNLLRVTNLLSLLTAMGKPGIPYF